MRRSVLLLALAAGWLAAGCRGKPPAPIVAEVSGTAIVPGVSAPVRVVRDTWGVPHIYAQTQDDLFIAQGFVQAQDRLFQMDLWRRSAQGRLAQVLGPNFVERDAMTRRIQYHGDVDAEWASYGPDTKAIAAAFVRGINTWVALARERPPEEFVAAGWLPEYWSPVDLLNRTDAWLESGDAIDEVRRTGKSEVIADALRGAGAAPFFAGGTPMPPPLVSVRSPARVGITAPRQLSMSDPRATLVHPSARYLVHLNAPRWNVIGMTAPWRPGVVAGHNARIAWVMARIDADTQDVYTEPAHAQTVAARETIFVKGRPDPFMFDLVMTPHGVVIASDRERQRVYTIRWSGAEPGTAPELASLAIDRAGDVAQLRAALAGWKMPARRVVFLDADGNSGFQDVALVPVRRAGEWAGWRMLDELPHGAWPLLNPGVALRPAHDSGVAVADEAVFAHPLAVTAARRQRFNIGPLPRPAGDDSPVRLAIDTVEWDRSQAMNAPGQSGSPASAHFSDLAKLWSSGDLFQLAFTDAAVQAHAAATLTLVSAPPRR
jgi:penicillin amidase